MSATVPQEIQTTDVSDVAKGKIRSGLLGFASGLLINL